MPVQLLETFTRWELYKVLAEPIRLRLLALVTEEELAIGELAELLKESQPNISRHLSPLKHLGLVQIRKQGTRSLVQLKEGVLRDSVVADALSAGRRLCALEGQIENIQNVLAKRELPTKEFFASLPVHSNGASLLMGESLPELSSYLGAFSMLLKRRRLAVDAGTGEGRLLDVIAPSFEHVLAFDREAQQIEKAKKRVASRGFLNVSFYVTEVSVARKYVHNAAMSFSESMTGADVVFAVRLLHHAPKPQKLFKSLASLLARDGALVLLDYARHEDESMRNQADIWLGFGEEELKKFAGVVGLSSVKVAPIPPPIKGPDAHLPWQVMIARA